MISTNALTENSTNLMTANATRQISDEGSVAGAGCLAVSPFPMFRSVDQSICARRGDRRSEQVVLLTVTVSEWFLIPRGMLNAY